MHPRGEINRPDGGKLVRGSVWVEQEIAILAFITEVLKKRVPIYFYRHRSVGLEGIRSVLLTNARVEFVDEDDVRKDVEALLPSVEVVPFAEYDARYEVTFKPVEQRSDEHIYELLVHLENCGTVRITDFELIVNFPRAFLTDPTGGGGDVGRKQYKFRSEQYAPNGLYAGQRLARPFRIGYKVNDELFKSAHMASTFEVELRSADMTPKQSAHSIKEFSEF